MLDINPNELQIWQIDLTYQHNIENLYNVLDQAEKSRAHKFCNEILRRNYIITRGILRTILAKYLKISPPDIQFTYNKYGKPGVARKTLGGKERNTHKTQSPSPSNSKLSNSNCPFNYARKLNFNLSHSGNFIIYAFTLEDKIGVDLEVMRNIKNPEKIVERFFSSEEIKKLKVLPKTEYKNAFFHCWTRKEAFIKALGLGLAYPLNRFSVSVDSKCRGSELHNTGADSNFEISNKTAHWKFKILPSLTEKPTSTKLHADLDSKDWTLLTFYPAPNYIASLAVAGKITKTIQCEL